MEKFFITCELPDGKNYFCSFKKVNGVDFIEWDLDKTFARTFFNQELARDYINRMRVEGVKIEPAK